MLVTPALAEVTPQERPHPAYDYLRFDEDFSYLEQRDTSAPRDLFDPIKNIRIGVDLRLRFGGELRLRYESELNKFLLSGPQATDGFLLTRTALHFELRYRRTARLFFEGIHADVFGREELLFFIHRNRADIHQLFAELYPVGPVVSLRVGRQEMAHGTQRLISASGWGRIRKRFDAAKITVTGTRWSVASWWGRPVVTDITKPDRRDPNTSFYGAYGTVRPLPLHELDVYVLGHTKSGDLENPNGQSDARAGVTLGARVAGTPRPLDYEVEFSVQPWRRWAGAAVRAWSVGGLIAYTLLGAPTQPRIALRFEVASGDDDPFDESVETFNQLYRQERELLGYLALFGRQNIQTVNVNVGAWLVPRALRLDAFIYNFWLHSNSDAIYNPGGLPIPGRRDPTGSSGNEIGQELDVTLGWLLGPHHSMLAGYSQFWSSDFVRATGGGQNPRGFYLQYKLLF